MQQFIVLGALLSLYVTMYCLFAKVKSVISSKHDLMKGIFLQAEQIKKDKIEKEKRKLVYIDPEILDQNYVDRRKKDYSIRFDF